MSERRLEGRYLCADLIRVDWLDGEDEFQTIEALLEDISSYGGCVQVEKPIPLGATMMITIAESQFTGSVCYCVHREFGYFVGVRFSDENTWSKETAEPDHLFNPQQLTTGASER